MLHKITKFGVGSITFELHTDLTGMKSRIVLLVLSLFILAACRDIKKLEGVYRVYWGEKNGYKIWIVDGYKVRQDIYREFLYGGNEQRYLFNPKGEIWIDHAISCEEFELTLAHELNERALMANYAWAYEKAHDSSLMLELQMRKAWDSACRAHESGLKPVCPEDATASREIPGIADSIKINGIYRVPLGQREGISVWIVDGYRVRALIFPDFGLSGNDKAYKFIPSKEIWIDGQVSSEETGFSIQTELLERRLMEAGMSYGQAYDSAINVNARLRKEMKKIVENHPPLFIPPVLARDTGVRD